MVRVARWSRFAAAIGVTISAIGVTMTAGCAHELPELSPQDRAQVCAHRPHSMSESLSLGACLGGDGPIVSMGDVVATRPEARFDLTVNEDGVVDSVSSVAAHVRRSAGRSDAEDCVERYLLGRRLFEGRGVSVRLRGTLDVYGISLEGCPAEPPRAAPRLSRRGSRFRGRS